MTLFYHAIFLFVVFGAILFSFLPILKALGHSAVIVSSAFGILIWLVASFFDLQTYALAFFVYIFIAGMKKQNLKPLRVNIENWPAFLCLFFLITICYINSIRYWEYGPPHSNTDTLWNIGIVAFFKNNTNFLNFSDPHVYGISFNYHFFSQLIVGSVSRFTQSSAITAAVIGNSVPLLFTYIYLYSYFSTKFGNLKKTTVGFIVLYSICSLGVLGIAQPFSDALINTLGYHLFSAFLGVTWAIFFTTLILVSYFEIIFDDLKNKTTSKTILTTFGFCFISICLLFTKAPYFVVLFGSLGVHYVFFILKSGIDSKSKGFLASQFFILFVIFICSYVFYFSKNAEQTIPMKFGSIIKLFLNSHFQMEDVNPFLLVAISPLFSLVFLGLNSIFLVLTKQRLNLNKNFNLMFYAFLSVFIVASFGLLFFKLPGHAEIYFGFSGICIINFLFTYSLCERLENLPSHFDQIILKIVFTVLGLTVISLFLKSDYEKLSPFEKLEAEACQFVKKHCVKKNCLVAVNLHENNRHLNYSSEFYRFFRCSANSERQILVEGFDYVPRTVANKNLIDSLLLRNFQVFQSNSWQNIDYIVDFKSAIVGKNPKKEFIFEDYKISVYENK